MGEWYYIGHYGQLGPLTREQIDDLIRDGVIARDTYVWKNGMTDWLAAERVAELAGLFVTNHPNTPPPPPSARPPGPAPMPQPPTFSSVPSPMGYHYPVFSTVKSDRSRLAGGILQIIPGVGRMYLGYTAYGVLQLFLGMCGVGILWSWIDGLIILAGGVKLDGYGRQLQD